MKNVCALIKDLQQKMACKYLYLQAIMFNLSQQKTTEVTLFGYSDGNSFICQGFWEVTHFYPISELSLNSFPFA